MSQRDQETLKQLYLADPVVAEKVAEALQGRGAALPAADVVLAADRIIWGLSQADALGQAIAQGFCELIGFANEKTLRMYGDLVQQAGEKGATIGSIMATHLVPVLKTGDSHLLKRYLDAIAVMTGKGTYTLRKPLEALSAILADGDQASALASLALFSTTFAQEMTYNQSLNLTYVLPKALVGFTSARRVWQIEALTEVVRCDFQLAEPFLEGMAKGLDLLAPKQLGRFLSMGLGKYASNKALGTKFLALASKLGLDTCREMQVTVPLVQVQSQLTRYLSARIGLGVTVRSLSDLSLAGIASGPHPRVCSDGRHIYLSDEISRFSDREANRNLYKQMARLEAAYFEFDTFAFDLEKALDRIDLHRRRRPEAGQPPLERNLALAGAAGSPMPDLALFFSCFPNPELANDLFAVFEHGRLRLNLTQRYPGIVRQVYPLVQQEARGLYAAKAGNSCLLLLYAWVALGFTRDEIAAMDDGSVPYLLPLVALFEDYMQGNPDVEVSAEMVWQSYTTMGRLLELRRRSGRTGAYEPLTIPFGRCLRPDLFFGAHRAYEQAAAEIKRRLATQRLKIYKSDICRHLLKNNGQVTREDLEALIICPHAPGDEADAFRPRAPIDLSWLDLNGILGCDGLGPLQQMPPVNGRIYRYAEWDCRLADYLGDHVQVIERPLTGSASDFYERTLQRHNGLIKGIRRAFEHLKPEGYKVLRQWIDGDDFDYRALLDYAVERRAARMPSERLYIKRVKAQRDVAVMLLVDLSRSTANRAYGTTSRVIEIEKEAIVLLCEALEIVGDAYAIAGFSGTGRLGVDYFRIKDFEEQLDAEVRGRIQAMTPQRSTRMGAAIRHAAGVLGKRPSKVRLLVVLGDGFPNDIDYKKKYAIEDTSKAVTEARAKNLHVKGITVNITGDSRLDAVYGNFHHSVITDVRELPDKLLRIYGTLTRC
jgi:hypothetical protein